MESAENNFLSGRAHSGFAERFVSPQTSSFVELAAQIAPDILPAGITSYSGEASGGGRGLETGGAGLSAHGTTIVAASFAGGVMLAGDRRATMGNYIAQKDIRKVFAADEFSLVGIAGAAGIAMELVRLFQVELEHFEKVEAAALSLAGKANRLSAIIRQNLGLAMRGLAVVALFAGWDSERECGRIFSYDATGGKYEETGFCSVGSGSMFARGALKKLYRPELSEAECAQVLVQALFDAADDDSATGGPDVKRQIYPLVFSATADGVKHYDLAQMEQLVGACVGAGTATATRRATAEKLGE